MGSESGGTTRGVVDALFERHAAAFGSDYEPYRNHVLRMLGLISAAYEVPAEQARALGIAAFFHDAGIWLDHTWNYLPSSVGYALAELGDQREEHGAVVTAMIEEHHRMRSARHPDPLVNAFRRSDWTEVSLGGIRMPGVSRREYRALLREHPRKGFVRMLAKGQWLGLREDPLHPLPMMKL